MRIIQKTQKFKKVNPIKMKNNICFNRSKQQRLNRERKRIIILHQKMEGTCLKNAKRF